MAPPMIAPPTRPAAMPGPQPQPPPRQPASAAVGVPARIAALVAIAAAAVSSLFMCRLLERHRLAPQPKRVVRHGRSQKQAWLLCPNFVESDVNGPGTGCRARYGYRQVSVVRATAMIASVAHAHVTNAPAPAVPEPLALDGAARPVAIGPVGGRIIGRSRRPDDGAGRQSAEHAGRDRSAPAAMPAMTPLGIRRRRRRQRPHAHPPRSRQLP